MKSEEPFLRDDKPVPQAPLSQIHDAYFKAMLGWPQLRADLMRYCLPPPLQGMLVGEPPKQETKDFLGDHLQEFRADAVLTARLDATPPNECLHLLLEHKSAPDPAIHAQLATYQAAIMRRQATRANGADFRYRAVIKQVVYNGFDPWPTPLRSSGQTGDSATPAALAEAATDSFDSSHGLLALRQTPADRLCSGYPRLAACMLALRGCLSAGEVAKWRKESPDLWQSLEPPAEALLARVAAGLKDAPTLLKRQTVSYTLCSNRWEADDNAIDEMATTLLGKVEGAKYMMSYVERRIEEAKPGILAQGMAESLIRQLEHRFGTLPDDTTTHIRKAGPAELARWTERVLDAPTMEAVFTDEPLSPRTRFNGEP